MKVNDYIYTPRFCNVKIHSVFENKDMAYQNGFTEPTHYHEFGFTVLGKIIGENRMIFAGVKEN